MSQAEDKEVVKQSDVPVAEAVMDDTANSLAIRTLYEPINGTIEPPPGITTQPSSRWFWLLSILIAITLATLYLKFPNQSFGIALIGSGLLIAIILLKIPKWQVAHLKNLKPEELFNQENEARKTIAQIIGGILVLGGLYYTQENIRVTQEAGDKNRELTREGQITDRFTKAVGQLADQKMEVRLGGIFALERIARDSGYDQGPIMQIMTTYLQEKAPNRVGNTDEEDRFPYMPIDTQAILDVLGRRSRYFKNPEGRSIHQEGKARFSAQELQNKVTTGELIVIYYTKLGSAQFTYGHFEGCSFIQSDLTSAQFIGALLQEATFQGNRMKYASFKDANLQGSFFSECDLREATFDGADLRGADFREVKGLEWDQIKNAIIDESTKLPIELERQRANQKAQ